MIRTWEEALIALNGIESPAEKLQFVLNDIWEENGVESDISRINLFMGRAFSRGGKYYIHEIQTIIGEPLGYNPYATEQWELTASIGSTIRFQEGEGVVFEARIDALRGNFQLIKTKKINTFEQLGIVSYDQVIDGILTKGFAPQYRDNLLEYQYHQKWPEAFQEFLNQRTTVDSLRAEVDNIRQQISDAEKERNDIIEATERKKGEAETAAREAEQAAQERIEAARASTASLQSEIALSEAKKRQAEAEVQLAVTQVRELQTRIDAYRHRYETLFPLNSDELEYLKSATLVISSPDSLQSIISRLEYSYDPNQIVTFLMALNTSQIIALCGDPGTGKTSFARQMASALGAKFHLIEVQNNWTDRSDILGFYNPTNGTYQSTPFLDALIEARDEEEYCIKHNCDCRLHIICLDEMNLARVEYYFATFLSLLQQKPEERVLSVLPWDSTNKANNDAAASDNDDKLLRYRHLYIPSNVRFVGTMNMDDTAQNLSPKVVDRCIFIEFSKTAIAEENTEYRLENAYFPARYFSETWSPSAMPEIDQELSQISADPKKGESGFIAGPRLRKYAKCMWPLYRLLVPDGSVAAYDDLLLCGKVLPSISSVSQASKIGTEFPLACKRLEDGQVRGKRLHPYDTDSWSYWE
ncbi:MAG: AAA family ATPase [Clostridia bacterium]|nr:AAA family ATPase [Clostridia bacterium]